MLGISSSLVKGGASLLTFVKDNLKLYLDFKSNKSDTLKFPSEGSTSFDGSDDNIAISHSSDLSFGTNPHTISAWAKLDVLANFKTIISKRQAGGTATDYNLSVGANGVVYTYNGSATAQTATGVISTGSWFHYALVYDGSAYQLYINGSAVAWASGTTTSGASNSHDVAIGWDRTGNYWDGQIANVALWSRELTSEEIQSIQKKSYSQLKGVEETSLVAWWALDTDFNDSKGSNNGTNNGATINNTVYGGNAPVLPRAVDTAREGQADNIGNGSASFNGSSDRISFSPLSITGDASFTITAWIKPDTITGGNTVVVFGDDDTTDSAKRVALYFNAGKPYFAFWGSDVLHDSSVIQANEWQHFAITYSGGNTTTANSAIYLNGVSLSLTGGTASPLLLENDIFQIGADHNPSQYFDGLISQVGIWRGALTQSQIQSVFESTSYSKIPADVKSTLGADELPSPDLTSGTGLTITQGTTGTLTHDTTAGTITATNDVQDGYLRWFSASLEENKLYKLEIVVDSYTGGRFRTTLGWNGSNIYPSVGTNIQYFVGSSTASFGIRIDDGNPAEFVISRISVKEVTNDIVAYYPLDADNSNTSNGAGITNDLTTGEVLSDELVGDPSFDTGGSANINISNTTDTEVTGGALEYTDGSLSNVTFKKSSANILTIGKVYKVVFTITESNSYARIQFTFDENSGTFGSYSDHQNYADGTYTLYIIADRGNAVINISGSSPSFKMTDISIKEVTSNTGVLK